MSACSRCGTVAKATDKFCNVCGTPLARTGASNAPPPQAAPQYAPRLRPGCGGRRLRPDPGASPAARRLRGRVDRKVPDGSRNRRRGRATALRATPSRSTRCSLRTSRRTAAAPPKATPPQGPRGTVRRRGPALAGIGASQPQGGGYGAAPQYAPPAPAQPQAYAPAASPFGAQPGQPFGGTPAPQGAYAPAQQPGYAPAAPAGYGAQPGAPATFPSDTARDAAPPRILRGFLVAYDANPSGDFWPLTGGRLIVGRLGAVEGIDISMQDADDFVAARGHRGRRRERLDRGRGYRLDERYVRQRRTHRLQRPP